MAIIVDIIAGFGIILVSYFVARIIYEMQEEKIIKIKLDAH